MRNVKNVRCIKQWTMCFVCWFKSHFYAKHILHFNIAESNTNAEGCVRILYWLYKSIWHCTAQAYIATFRKTVCICKICQNNLEIILGGNSQHTSRTRIAYVHKIGKGRKTGTCLFFRVVQHLQWGYSKEAENATLIYSSRAKY